MKKYFTSRHWLPALPLVLALVLAACGRESEGMLSDNLICNVSSEELVKNVEAIDAANADTESTVAIGGMSADILQPSTIQTFSLDVDKNIWGVALKLYAPQGAAGDVVVNIVDSVDTTATTAPQYFATKSIKASTIEATPTWYLVDFGELAALTLGTPYRLALSGKYEIGASNPVLWATIPGSGVQTLTPGNQTTATHYTWQSMSAVYELEACK